MKPTFKCFAGSAVSDALLQECSELYAAHYGTWGEKGPRPGQQVRQRPEKIRELLASNDAQLAIAREAGRLVAYAAAVRPSIPGSGKISWVTQLVVHTDFRKGGIATRLLFAFWQFSDHFAWGLVTANPFAVRALEKATRRRVLPTRASHSVEAILQAGRLIPYIRNDSLVDCNEGSSAINTEFFVDHSGVPDLVSQASRNERWLLGDLQDGWEWFAFTFRDQKQFPLGSEELKEMLKISDEQTAEAYARMTLDDNHKWRGHATYEAQFVWQTCGLHVGSRVLDLGCGDGRHVLALASMGASAVGVDYVDARVESAKKAAEEKSIAARFLVSDARVASLGEKFDCVICLYDVVGSYADNADNLRIVQVAASHAAVNGFVMISVMNFELTKHVATMIFSVVQEPDRLLSLGPGDKMEASGNIFDPDYFMLDLDDQVVYRKEQFSRGSNLPAEMLVRDRRFRAAEIEAMCKDSGLHVEWSRYVKLGEWDKPLDPIDPKAKEILVLCRKP